jgi:SAM-dependent methyltransferase
MDSSAHGPTTAKEGMWRGLDLSGVTVVLGIGTGRLIQLLHTQILASSGLLLVAGPNRQSFAPLLPLRAQGHLTFVQALPRRIPLLAESVDLLVANGVLREAPEGKLEGLFEEWWRVLVPGARIRLSDVLEPSPEDEQAAWSERNRIVRKMASILGRPAALAADPKLVALAMRGAGFERLSISLLPGLGLTDAWLEETVIAIQSLASRVANKALREEILTGDVNRLIARYALGQQRAAPRFVLQGAKPGDMALAMESAFTEQDLLDLSD